MPVLLSPQLVDLYNVQYAPSHGLPVIGDMQEYLLAKRGLRFTIRLGATTTQFPVQVNAPPRDVEAELVAVSEDALAIGMTLPLESVRAWNLEYAGEKAAGAYSTIRVTIDERRLAAFETWLGENGLRVR